MAERTFFIVVVLILKFNGEIFAQQKIVEKISPLTEKWEHYTASNHLFKTAELTFKKSPIQDHEPISNLVQFVPNYPITITKSYTLPVTGSFVQTLPFFCRAEYRFEKATSIPFKFRLGSIDYTDYLEQKPNAIAPRR